MKIKTQLTLASVIAAGLLASGCSQQMVAQQSAPVETVVAAEVPATVVKTIVDCASCNKPAAPRQGGNLHGHPAIPGCTDSIKHNHPHAQGGRHSHKYSCKKPARVAPRPAPRPAPMPAPRPAPRVNADSHTHPAVPNCTRSVSHVHPNGRRTHSHRYACQQPRRMAPQPQRRIQQPAHQPVPMMPKVKAKGHYKGAIAIDGVMQQYAQ